MELKWYQKKLRLDLICNGNCEIPKDDANLTMGGQVLNKCELASLTYEQYEKMEGEQKSKLQNHVRQWGFKS